MATMTISLPDGMQSWVEAQTAAGRYSTASDLVRDLIGREQVRAEKIANLQRLLDEADESGVSDETVEAIFARAQAEYEAERLQKA